MSLKSPDTHLVDILGSAKNKGYFSMVPPPEPTGAWPTEGIRGPLGRTTANRAECIRYLTVEHELEMDAAEERLDDEPTASDPWLLGKIYPVYAPVSIEEVEFRPFVVHTITDTEFQPTHEGITPIAVYFTMMFFSMDYEQLKNTADDILSILGRDRRVTELGGPFEDWNRDLKAFLREYNVTITT